ncbi:MAG TPA: hypothetical protein VI603_15140 [Saprospiraceae bacterium]|nr:hypothetical protein [Saprospiraceae bacterium]
MKHDITKHPYWSYDEFVAFLLFYAAKADMEFIDEEREMILKIVSEEKFSQIEQEYYRLTDFERINVIQAYKSKFYASATKKNEIIEKIKKLCTADGEFDIMEQNMVMMIQKIL